MRYIIHLADIHIRLQSRHEEYSKVFATLYEECSKITDAVIVICGDILHAKTNLTPECIILTRDFLRNLSMIHPTVFIAGNHDCNLANNEKIDSLSAIIETMPNLYYLKETSVFLLDNILFHTMSLLDNIIIEQSEILELKESNHLIGLYHGMLSGSKNSLGYSLPGGISVSEFKKYNHDLLLLGDIHQYQTFTINGKEKAAYPGSLIQQNFGESVDHHGFILWDLQDYSHTYVEIPNDFISISIPIINNEPVIPAYTYKYAPSNAKYRVIMPSDTSASEALVIDKKLKEANISSYIVHKTTQKKISNGTSTNLQSIIEQNVIDLLWEKFPNHDKYDKNRILSLHSKYNLISSGFTRQSYVIENIEFGNLFCYGPSNKFNLNKNGVMSIVAMNHAGKSALLDIILYAITDQTSRTRTVQDIMRIGTDQCFVKLTILMNGHTFVITKISKKKTGKKITITNDVQFTKDGANLNCESIVETKQLISKYFGTYQQLTQHSFCVQSDVLGIISMTSTDRKKVMTSLIGLESFEKIHKTVKADIVSIESQIKILNEQNRSLLIKTIDTSNYDTVKQLSTELTLRINELQTEKNVFDQQIKDIQILIYKLEGKKSSIKISENKFSENKFSEIEDRPYVFLPSDITPEKNIKHEEIFCAKNPTPKTWEAYKEKLDDYIDIRNREILQEYAVDINTMKSVLNSQEQVLMKQEINKIELEINGLKESKKVPDQESTRIDKDIAILHLQKREQDNQLLNMERSRAINNQLDELHAENTSKITVLTDQLTYLQYYLSLTHLTGIPTLLLESIVPALEDKVNIILSTIVDFSVLIKITDSEWQIIYKDDTLGRSLPIECCSGFEMRITAVALRLALRDICSLGIPNIFVLDESFASADTEHRATLPMLLTRLKEYIPLCIVVSHTNDIASVSDHIVNLNVGTFTTIL